MNIFEPTKVEDLILVKENKPKLEDFFVNERLPYIFGR